MRTPDEIQVRSASMYRWLMDHFGGAEHLPEKLILHFEVDVPDLIAEIERLRSEVDRLNRRTTSDESAILDLIGERDERELRLDDLATAIGEMVGVDMGEHSNDNDPWSNALQAVKDSARYVQAIDFDDTLIWQQPDRHLIYTDPEYDGVDLKGLVPLFRRVTEPAGSVTT